MHILHHLATMHNVADRQSDDIRPPMLQHCGRKNRTLDVLVLELTCCSGQRLFDGWSKPNSVVVNAIFTLVLVQEKTLRSRQSFAVNLRHFCYYLWFVFFFHSSVRLRTLLRALSPSLLRVGGSPADYLFFDKPSSIIKSLGLQPNATVASS